MSANKGRGSLGVGYNSPTIDSGTLSRSSSPLPGSQNVESFTTKQIGVKAKAFSPKGYVIVSQQTRSLLSNQSWEQARIQINKVFNKAGGLQAIFVNTFDKIPQLNLTDGVVECYEDASQATVGFRTNVSKQLVEFARKIVALWHLNKKFNNPDHYSVTLGRSYTVKGLFEVPICSLPQIACITYGVIAMKPVFNMWRGLLRVKKKATFATIGSASQSEQSSFGIALGNLVAHELRHQLGFSKTGLALDHTGSGLGKDGADFCDHNIKFSDDERIRKNLLKLHQFQNM
jgi:hypothetical protein